MANVPSLAELLRRLTDARGNTERAAITAAEKKVLTDLDDAVQIALREGRNFAVVHTIQPSDVPPSFGLLADWLRMVCTIRPLSVYELTRNWLTTGVARTKLQQYGIGGCSLLVDYQNQDAPELVAVWADEYPLGVYQVGHKSVALLYAMPHLWLPQPAPRGWLLRGTPSQVIWVATKLPDLEPEPEIEPEIELETETVAEEVLEVPALRPSHLKVLQVVWHLLADGPSALSSSQIATAVGRETKNRGVITNIVVWLVAAGTLTRTGEKPKYVYGRGNPWVQPVDDSGQPIGQPVDINDLDPILLSGE